MGTLPVQPISHMRVPDTYMCEAVWGSMENVVKITCFLTDVANYPAYSKVRAETFPSNPPASSTVIVAGLVRPELLVEVEAVVHLL